LEGLARLPLPIAPKISLFEALAAIAQEYSDQDTSEIGQLGYGLCKHWSSFAIQDAVPINRTFAISMCTDCLRSVTQFSLTAPVSQDIQRLPLISFNSAYRTPLSLNKLFDAQAYYCPLTDDDRSLSAFRVALNTPFEKAGKWRPISHQDGCGGRSIFAILGRESSRAPADAPIPPLSATIPMSIWTMTGTGKEAEAEAGAGAKAEAEAGAKAEAEAGAEAEAEAEAGAKAEAEVAGAIEISTAGTNDKKSHLARLHSAATRPAENGLVMPSAGAAPVQNVLLSYALSELPPESDLSNELVELQNAMGGKASMLNFVVCPIDKTVKIHSYRGFKPELYADLSSYEQECFMERYSRVWDHNLAILNETKPVNDSEKVSSVVEELLFAIFGDARVARCTRPRMSESSAKRLIYLLLRWMAKSNQLLGELTMLDILMDMVHFSTSIEKGIPLVGREKSFPLLSLGFSLDLTDVLPKGEYLHNLLLYGHHDSEGWGGWHGHVASGALHNSSRLKDVWKLMPGDMHASVAHLVQCVADYMARERATKVETKSRLGTLHFFNFSFGLVVVSFPFPFNYILSMFICTMDQFQISFSSSLHLY
jgi:hypothetical protein